MNPGRSLTETLERFHITQAELARASGLHQHMISEFRAGKSDLKVRSLYRILQGLPAPARFYYLSLLCSDIDDPPDHGMHIHPV